MFPTSMPSWPSLSVVQLLGIALVFVLLCFAWCRSVLCRDWRLPVHSEREPLLPTPYSVPRRPPGYTQQQDQHPRLPPPPQRHDNHGHLSQRPTAYPQALRPQAQPSKPQASSSLARLQEPPAGRRSRRRVPQYLNNQDSTWYIDVRERAGHAYDEMKRCERESRAARQAGEHALAKRLSEQEEVFRRKHEALDFEASEWIYRQNNVGRGPDEVDLHDLYVKEAIVYADRAIATARARGANSVQLIVGRGKHSPNGVSKLRPAIEAHMQRKLLVTDVDRTNPGILIVRL